ncbi:MAG: rod shape-determining protein MreD [Candidatus Cloacimonetes bacterium]|nr:rod shape-determining protein MreD [Candidatus Cloacimonadota bacterium]
MKLFKFIILAILIFYFQLLMAAKFSVMKIIPNFLISFIIMTSIIFSERTSLIFAFFMGVAFDLTYPTMLGLNSLSFLVISYLVSSFHPSINKERFPVVILGVLSLNIVYYLFFFLHHLFSNMFTIPGSIDLLVAILYNSIISLVTLYLLVLIDHLKLCLDV